MADKKPQETQPLDMEQELQKPSLSWDENPDAGTEGLSKPFEFSRFDGFGAQDAVFQALGAASTAWVGGTGDAVFDSARASEIGNALLNELASFLSNQNTRLQAMSFAVQIAPKSGDASEVIRMADQIEKYILNGQEAKK